MKKNYSDFQIELPSIDLAEDIWLENTIKLVTDNHLICIGENSDLQWFGTSLIQKCGQIENSEISSIYGKLASNFDDFCHQLCHSTPWVLKWEETSMLLTMFYEENMMLLINF